jgi:hypothetical protein
MFETSDVPEEQMRIYRELELLQTSFTKVKSAMVAYVVIYEF